MKSPFINSVLAALAVLLTAETLGAIFVYAVLDGPPIVKGAAFFYGSLAALIGALAFLGLRLAGRKTPPSLGAASGGLLTALTLWSLPAHSSIVGCLMFCPVGALIGGVSALSGQLATANARLPQSPAN